MFKKLKDSYALLIRYRVELRILNELLKKYPIKNLDLQYKIGRRGNGVVYGSYDNDDKSITIYVLSCLKNDVPIYKVFLHEYRHYLQHKPGSKIYQTMLWRTAEEKYMRTYDEAESKSEWETYINSWCEKDARKFERRAFKVINK